MSPASQSSHSSSRGFTIIEMLVVITVIAIIMLIAVPGMNGVIQANRLSSAGDQVLSLISYADQLVATDGRPVEIRMLQYQDVGGTGLANYQTVLVLRHYAQYEMGPDSQIVQQKEGISVLAADPMVLPNGIVISASSSLNTTNSTTACITTQANGLVATANASSTAMGDLMVFASGSLVPYNLTYLGNVTGSSSTLTNFCSFTIYSEGTSFPNPALVWYFMLVDEKDEANTNLSFTTLHNFYCIQIDPYSGHPTYYRP